MTLWHSSGLSVHHPQFETYFVSLEDKVLSMVQESLDVDLKARTVEQLAIAQAGLDQGPPWLLAEVRDHLQYAERLKREFTLPEVEAVVNLLSRPWTGARAQPAFLLGAVGSGKTNVIAAVAVRLTELEHLRTHGRVESSFLTRLSSSHSQVSSSPLVDSTLLFF